MVAQPTPDWAVLALLPRECWDAAAWDAAGAEHTDLGQLDLSRDI